MKKQLIGITILFSFLGIKGIGQGIAEHEPMRIVIAAFGLTLWFVVVFRKLRNFEHKSE
jgi:hypothetical protein